MDYGSSILNHYFKASIGFTFASSNNKLLVFND